MGDYRGEQTESPAGPTATQAAGSVPPELELWPGHVHAAGAATAWCLRRSWSVQPRGGGTEGSAVQ